MLFNIWQSGEPGGLGWQARVRGCGTSSASTLSPWQRVITTRVISTLCHPLRVCKPSSPFCAPVTTSLRRTRRIVESSLPRESVSLILCLTYETRLSGEMVRNEKYPTRLSFFFSFLFLFLFLFLQRRFTSIESVIKSRIVRRVCRVEIDTWNRAFVSCFCSWPSGGWNNERPSRDPLIRAFEIAEKYESVEAAERWIIKMRR